MTGLSSSERRFEASTPFHLAELVVRGAARQATEQRVPELAGTLITRVLAGLRERVQAGVDHPLENAEALAADAARSVLGEAEGVAAEAALAVVQGVLTWQRLDRNSTAALESIARGAATEAARDALEAAGRLSIALLRDEASAPAAAESDPERAVGAQPCAQAPGRGKPPLLAQTLLRTLAPASDRDCLLGDLEEEFSDSVVAGIATEEARAWYWRQAVGSITPLIRMRLIEILGRLGTGSQR